MITVTPEENGVCAECRKRKAEFRLICITLCRPCAEELRRALKNLPKAVKAPTEPPKPEPLSSFTMNLS
jgi:hypothetical protein